jgi:hypothetical protein
MNEKFTERYQWMPNRAGGQRYGNKQIITPLTEELFNQHVRDKVQPETFMEYRKLYPRVTHISIVQKADGSTVLGSPSIGSLNELRPQREALRMGWAKKVDSFNSSEAKFLVHPP